MQTRSQSAYLLPENIAMTELTVPIFRKEFLFLLVFNMQLKSYFLDQCTANDRRFMIFNGHIDATGCVLCPSLDSLVLLSYFCL